MKKIAAVAVLFLFCSAYSFAANIDTLVDKLVEKGQLTQQEGADLKKEAVKAPEKEKAAYPEMKISGFTQFSYTSDPTLGGVEPFGIKVARFGLTYKLNSWLDFKIQPEISKGATTGVVELKELWAKVMLDKDVGTVIIGQYYVPFGFENNYPTSKRKVFDSPNYLTKVLLSQYDYGVQLCGSLPGDDLRELLNWRFAVINGSTTGLETDSKKDVAGMLVSKPMKDVELSASVYFRHFTTGDRYETQYDLAGKYEGDCGIPLFFSLEYSGGKDLNGTKDAMNVIATLEAKPFGLVSSNLSFLAPVIRLERWDANIWDDTYVSYYTVGLNIYADKAFRILFDYVMKDDNIADNNKFNALVQINY